MVQIFCKHKAFILGMLNKKHYKSIGYENKGMFNMNTIAYMA